MGEAGAERMLVRGDKISAEEALNLGLVMRVVKHEELLTTAQVTLNTDSDWLKQKNTDL